MKVDQSIPLWLPHYIHTTTITTTITFHVFQFYTNKYIHCLISNHSEYIALATLDLAPDQLDHEDCEDV